MASDGDSNRVEQIDGEPVAADSGSLVGALLTIGLLLVFLIFGSKGGD